MDLDLNSLTENLLRIRIGLGLTQSEVADAAGLSRLAYNNLESGRTASPKADTILRVATALGVTINDLIIHVPAAREIRFRSAKKLRTREQIISDVKQRLRLLNGLEDALDEHREYTLKGFRQRDPIQAAIDAREKLNLGEGPITNVCRVMEEAGIKVLTTKVASDVGGFFGLSVGKGAGGPAVCVNTWERVPVERWIFTAAHELGHLLLHHSSFDVEEEVEPKKEEEEANIFASFFLLPHAAFQEFARGAYGHSLVESVLAFKRVYKVSYKTVLYRIGDKGIWPKFQLAFKHVYGRTLSFKEEPVPLSPAVFRPEEPESLSPTDFPETRSYYLVRRALESQIITKEAAMQILDVDGSGLDGLVASWKAFSNLDLDG